jgi:hypothetical protein
MSKTTSTQATNETAQTIAPMFAQLIQGKPAKTADKAAGKASAKKPAAQAMKTAGDAKNKTAQAVKSASKAGAADTITHALVDGARPAAGGLLFSFTQAWLQASGLIAGGSIGRDKARKVAGSTAIAYHVKAGRFNDNKGALTLTPSGLSFFASRGADQSKVDMYMETLTKGKTSDLVKSTASIIKA